MVIVVEANKYNDHMSVKSSSLKDGIFKHYHLKKFSQGDDEVTNQLHQSNRMYENGHYLSITLT
ncbi:hypothetical protein DERP_000325 [Dermatophagoides pteronyssinus]|uniref:Uncharacterized protein n=1 Tax=Dermatophagoides pteronyssinus TaxID=6956 RepID=A0ABQ8IZT8_DERPT|nr:hypothetical protein DERP_000325 [Dermatophagoides pteronyssinus]